MADCIFCKIASGDMDAEIVLEDENVVAFRDLNPQAPTHVLIIPRKHIPTIDDLEGSDAEMMGKLFMAAKEVAQREGIRETGYRTVMNCQEGAGQSVFHVHLHVLGGRSMHWPPG